MGSYQAFLPNKPRGVPRVDDRRILNGIFWVMRSEAPWRDHAPRAGAEQEILSLRLYPVEYPHALQLQEAAICGGAVGDLMSDSRRDFVITAHRNDPYVLRENGEHTLQHEIMITRFRVTMPGNGVAGAKSKQPSLHIAPNHDRLNAFYFVVQCLVGLRRIHDDIVLNCHRAHGSLKP